MIESGIAIDTGSCPYFEMSICPTYRTLSGRGASVAIGGTKIKLGFKEMDIALCCNDLLYLIELTDFSHGELTVNYINTQIIEFFKKALDTFVLLMALKNETKYAEKIKICLPSGILEICENNLSFIFIVNNYSKLKKHHQKSFKDKINSIISPYFKLYDYNGLKITILDYVDAKRKLPFVL